MRRFVCCLASFVVFAAASPVAADGPLPVANWGFAVLDTATADAPLPALMPTAQTGFQPRAAFVGMGDDDIGAMLDARAAAVAAGYDPAGIVFETENGDGTVRPVSDRDRTHEVAAPLKRRGALYIYGA